MSRYSTRIRAPLRAILQKLQQWTHAFENAALKLAIRVCSRYDEWRQQSLFHTRRRLSTCEESELLLPREDRIPSTSFLKLPAELRMNIYEKYYLSHDKIRIERVREWKVRDRYLRSKLPRSGVLQRSLKESTGFASLPLTCRQLYAETIDYMYNCPTFSFSHPGALLGFRNSLLPHRWASITSIYLGIAYSYCITEPVDFSTFSTSWPEVMYFSPSTLNLACRALAALPDLAHLDVGISFEMGSYLEPAKALEPLAQIMDVRDFVVRTMVPRYAEREVEKFRTAPFQMLSWSSQLSGDGQRIHIWRPYFEERDGKASAIELN